MADEETINNEKEIVGDNNDETVSEQQDKQAEDVEKPDDAEEAKQDECSEEVKTAETAAEDCVSAKKYEELQTAYIRLQADFDNFRKRTKQEKDNIYKFALEDVFTEVLAVLDNFERALESKSDNAKEVAAGVEMIYKQLYSILEKNGLEKIQAFEQPFDPNLHNAVLTEETDKYPDNTVIQELQKGYTLNQRVIRPSMVKVSV